MPAMYKKIIFIAMFLFAAAVSEAQIKLPDMPKCGCPEVGLFVSKTTMNFSMDSSVEKDSYTIAKNSAAHLNGIYGKQQSDQLKIYNAMADSLAHQPDFASKAEIERSGTPGNYTYTITVKITDVNSKAQVAKSDQTTNELIDADAAIDRCVASFGLVLDSTIRKYQKKIRKESGNTKWIGLQWQAKGGKKVKINKSATVTITVTDCVSKLAVPHLPIELTQVDNNAGILSASRVSTDDSGKAAVIFTGLHKGETSVLANFSYTSVNGKEIRNPICCNTQKIVVSNDDFYKVTMDAETTVDGTGRDIKLHGESITALKTLADGTSMLEPVDKTRNMNITVEKGEAANADGGTGELTGPLQYTVPFLFSIGKMDKDFSSGHAIAYLNTTSPQKGKVIWIYTTDGKTVTETVDIDKGTLTFSPPGTTTLVPGAAGSLYAMDAATNLNLLSNLMVDRGITQKNATQNIANAEDKMAFAKRMQAHMNDPNYAKTEQGKKDMAEMQSLYQQVGGNVVNKSSTTKKINAQIAQKIKDTPGYAGSAQFKQDMSKLYLNSSADRVNYQKPAMAEVSPGSAMVRVEGDFEPKNSESFSESLQCAIGPLKTTVKITVEKIDD
jgi:hypothetical protein